MSVIATVAAATRAPAASSTTPRIAPVDASCAVALESITRKDTTNPTTGTAIRTRAGNRPPSTEDSNARALSIAAFLQAQGKPQLARALFPPQCVPAQQFACMIPDLVPGAQERTAPSSMDNRKRKKAARELCPGPRPFPCSPPFRIRRVAFVLEEDP